MLTVSATFKPWTAIEEAAIISTRSMVAGR